MSTMIDTFRDSSGELTVSEPEINGADSSLFDAEKGDDDHGDDHIYRERQQPDTKSALPWIQRTLTAERNKKKKAASAATASTKSLAPSTLALAASNRARNPASASTVKIKCGRGGALFLDY